MILQNLIVFEGCDGAGTTTQRRLLCEKLSAFSRNGKKFAVLDTAEPSEGPLGILLRAVLKGEVELHERSRAYLFAADRAEHIFGKDGVAAHCERGGIAVCDRYTLSSLVYQGIECGDELPARLNEAFPAPELLFFLDIEPETALERVSARGGREIYEHLDFQVKARAGYKRLLPGCAEAGSRVVVLDGGAPREETAARVWREVEKLPIFGEYGRFQNADGFGRHE
jgi:dTMP kinase